MKDPSPKPRTIRKRKVALAITAAILIVILTPVALVYDLPGLHDDPPDGIVAWADPQAKYRVYSLGGFIDEQFLVEVECNPAGLTQLIADLQLEPIASIPAQALRHRPWYWPKPGRTDLKAYKSMFFDPQERGQDGSHYLLLHDPKKGRAYVWWKDNF